METESWSTYYLLIGSSEYIYISILISTQRVLLDYSKLMVRVLSLHKILTISCEILVANC